MSERSESMTADEMYEAVINNDDNYDGLFFYVVLSTGIFCRPSCQSKKPLRENVRFFQNAGGVVPQNKIPVSCAKTANYNRIFINLSLTVCQKNGTLFFLCVSEISVIVVLVATDKKRERTTPTTARSFSHP